MHSPFFFSLSLAFALVLGAARADAHAQGLSQGDYDVTPAGHVDAHLVFARSDATTLARGETAPDLRDAVLHGVEVLADGDACAPSYLGEAAVGGDGLEVRATFDCPHPPRELSVALPLLDELPLSHVHLVRLASAGKEAHAALRSSGAHATLLLPRSPSPPLATRTRLLATALALVALLFPLLAARRRRRSTRP